MRRKYIPAIIMLAAGAITSIANLVNKVKTVEALKSLLIVLIIFYIIGLIVKAIIGRVLDNKVEQEELETSEEILEQEDQVSDN